MWHTLSVEKIIAEFKIDSSEGLQQIKARELFDIYGANELPKGKKLQWLGFFLNQIKSPLVYILLIGAALSAFFGEWIDTSVIMAAVFLNVIVGFWQEFKSSDILKKLSKIVQVAALVVRDGAIHEINAQEVVPGDIILLQAGKRVPADARIFQAKRLEINEALLTGESASIQKSTEPILQRNIAVGDRLNMAHMGTIVERGEGRAVVVATGAKTEIGKIALLTASAEEEQTPLQRRIGHLGKILAMIIAGAALLIFAVGIFEGHPFHQIFTTAIAVAVAGIPEGLPAAISIVLAISAQRILKRKGVVKRLLAAETLGSASVICADKTGTLTEGKMHVEKVITEGDEMHAREILALANEAIVEKKDDEIAIRGEMTDQAKIRSYLDAGGEMGTLEKKYPRVEILPFHPSRKYIASLHRSSDASLPKFSQGLKLFFTGAPENIINLSGHFLSSEGKKQLWSEKSEELEFRFKILAAEGYRMIAIAEKDLRAVDEKDIDLEDEKSQKILMQDLTFVGFAVIRDPLREDVKESIQIAREAGIRPIMLTGDHILTAEAIGRELGFRSTPDAVIEGVEIETMPELELAHRIRTVEIFARVNPEHKMRIIDILQKQGEVVAMTGDGVNDAPALKASDIGVALDSGTDVAKEASDLILLNDSFTIIVSAIKQGRIAFDNIRKVTVFLLVQSFTEVILVLAALLFRVPIPLTAAQILWTNLVEDSFPNLALSFEPGEKDIMKRAPFKKNEPILDKESMIIVYVVGLLADVLLLGLFLFLYHFSPLSIEHIRTFIFAAIGLDSFIYIYSIKSLRKPIFSYSLFDNPYLLGATAIGVAMMLAAIYVPFFNHILETVPLDLIDWIPFICLGLLKIMGVEAAKWWFIHRKA